MITQMPVRVIFNISLYHFSKDYHSSSSRM
nr:MAG TPA: hypothetical protein [Caudoviricetes sp.]